MEIDKILYIFGSFSRKKNSKEKRTSLQIPPSSLSAGSSPVRHRISQPCLHHDLDIPPRSSAYGYHSGYERKKVEEWQCGLCRGELIEPRLLGCLHSFCTGCLQELQHGGEIDDATNQEAGGSRSTSGAGSAGSGYESELRDNSGSDTSWAADRVPRVGIFTRKISGKTVQLLICPTCNTETQLPIGGISALPLNYVLLRRIAAADRHAGSRASVLCDLCNSDNKASSHCSQCLVSVCESCKEAHGRHRSTSRHSMRPLDLQPVRFCSQHPQAELSVYCSTCQEPVDAISIRSAAMTLVWGGLHPAVAISRLIEEAHGRHRSTSRHSMRPLDLQPVRFCSQHPQAELSVYCSTCHEVICRDCCIVRHAGHALGSAAAAAAERARRVRAAAERARNLPATLRHAAAAANATGTQIDLQASRVEAEVQSWAEQYRRAVDAHGRALCTAAARARARYRQKYKEYEEELETRVKNAEDAVKFAEEVLAEAKENELLSLSSPVISRLERVCDISSLSQPDKCELRFASQAPASGGLVGRLLTRAPDLKTCRLTTEGFQDLRVGVNHEAILELRDSDGERIWCGGEQVAGYFRRKDSSAVPFMAKVVDRNDGTYSMVICAPSPGAYYFAVTLNNKPIQGSPFPCAARTAKPHSGQYHCCAFCSSGGRRDATCACGGTMGGGYKGCGHGHAGHPGSRHWSCCGNTERRSQCTKDSIYHFSL